MSPLRALFFAVLCAAAAPAHAILDVTTASGGRNVAGACALRDAIAAVNTGLPAGGCPAGAPLETIYLLLPPGSQTISLSARDPDASNAGLPRIVANRRITIVGYGNTISRSTGTPCVTDNNRMPGEFRLFEATGALVLQDVELRNGCADGVLNTLDTYGGAIYATGGVTLDRVTIANSAAGRAGGAIYSTNEARIGASTLTGNIAEYGGAIASESSLLEVRGSLVWSNVSRAGRGSAIDFAMPGIHSLHIGNSTIIANIDFSGLSGASAISIAGFATIHFSTITGNTGFGIANGSEVQLRNVIVAGNSNRSCSNPGPQIHQGHNIFSDMCIPNFADEDDVYGVDPKLTPLADHGGPTLTAWPRHDSPAIDTALGCPRDQFDFEAFIDQERRARPSGPACDVGAVEFRDAIHADGFEPE